MTVVKPKIRGFICTTAHPEGCREHVKQQIEYVKQNLPIDGPKNVLVIGASTGYGLASWISAIFGAHANAVGVFYEREAKGDRTATAGWYNVAAVEAFAKQENIFVASVNGDAFADDVKAKTCQIIKNHLGKIDLIVYSLASPRRMLPNSGEVVNSVLKTTDKEYSNKTIDPIKGDLGTVTITPANKEEIAATVKVMGGEDWYLWMQALNQHQLLANGVKTIAYSYVGPEITYPIYRQGTIGKAKEHLEQTATEITQFLSPQGGQALVSVNKALVTQASAAIPVVPLYISLLYQVMKNKQIHEGCIEQIYRLFQDFVYSSKPIITDEKNRIRIDDLEMRQDVQDEIKTAWETVNQDNLLDYADLQGYQDDFYKLFGFGFKHIDYDKEVDIDITIPSLANSLLETV